MYRNGHMERDIFNNYPQEERRFPIKYVYTQSKTTYCNFSNSCSQKFSKNHFCMLYSTSMYGTFMYKYLVTHALVQSSGNVYFTRVSFSYTECSLLQKQLTVSTGTTNQPCMHRQSALSWALPSGSCNLANAVFNYNFQSVST